MTNTSSLRLGKAEVLFPLTTKDIYLSASETNYFTPTAWNPPQGFNMQSLANVMGRFIVRVPQLQDYAGQINEITVGYRLAGAARTPESLMKVQLFAHGTQGFLSEVIMNSAVDYTAYGVDITKTFSFTPATLDRTKSYYLLVENEYGAGGTPGNIVYGFKLHLINVSKRYL